MSKRKHEWTRKGVTASMAVVLAFGMVPAVPGVAFAGEVGEGVVGEAAAYVNASDAGNAASAAQQAPSLPDAKADSAQADVWDGSSVEYDWYTSVINTPSANPESSDKQFAINSAAELAGLAQLVNGTATAEAVWDSSSLAEAAGLSGETLVCDDFAKATIVLGNDVDLASYDWTPIGGADTKKQFAGTFDGGSHTISNLKIARGLENVSANNQLGLFGAGTGTAKLQSFTLENVDVAGCLNVGAVLGGSGGSEAKIADVHVTGSVKVSGWWYVGGIMGKGYTTVTDCSVEGDGPESSAVSITGGYVGGIVGYMGEGNCVTTGCSVKNVTVSGAYNGIGGVNGILHYGNTIEDCTVENVVVWETSDPGDDGRRYVGAFAGTFLDNGGKNCPTLKDNVFVGTLLSGAGKDDVTEADRYVGSLWYGSEPPATVNVENCTVSAPVAECGDTFYGSLPDAVEAAKNGLDKTVKLLSDITVDSWTQIWDIQGITLDGQNHEIVVKSIESLQNHDAVFHSAGGNTFKNLTVDLSGIESPSAAQGNRAFNAAAGDTFESVTIKGNDRVSYGISIGGTETLGESVVIDRCVFENLGYAVYDSESAAIENLVIRDSTMSGCGYAVILHSENGQFIGNSVEDGKLNVLSEKQVISDNVFSGESRIKFYAVPASFVQNKVSGESYLDANDGVTGIDVSKNYWGGGAPSNTQIPESVDVVGQGVYYVSDTMRDPYDLNTYVPPASPAPSEPEGEVTENEDGSTTTTVTGEDGSSVETTVSEDEGVTTVVEKDGDGAVVSITAKVTQEAVEAAGGEAVALPFAEPVEAKASGEAVAIEVEAPAKARIAVPVAKAEGEAAVAPGAVLALVDAEGGVTVLPKTANDGDSLSAEVPGDCTLKVVDASADFPDVADDAWYAKQGVDDFISARGVMTGVEVAPGSFEFQGDKETDRGMFVTMLHRLESEPAVDSEGFADVDPESWYADSSAWAVEAGIATGYENAEGNATFDGDGNVTREQMATFLFRYANWLGLDTSARADREIEGVSDFAEDAMSWAVAEGLIQGDDDTGAIRPGDGATRAEAAVVVMRMIDLMA